MNRKVLILEKPTDLVKLSQHPRLFEVVRLEVWHLNVNLGHVPDFLIIGDGTPEPPPPPRLKYLSISAKPVEEEDTGRTPDASFCLVVGRFVAQFRTVYCSNVQKKTKKMLHQTMHRHRQRLHHAVIQIVEPPFELLLDCLIGSHRTSTIEREKMECGQNGGHAIGFGSVVHICLNSG